MKDAVEIHGNSPYLIQFQYWLKGLGSSPALFNFKGSALTGHTIKLIGPFQVISGLLA